MKGYCWDPGTKIQCRILETVRIWSLTSSAKWDSPKENGDLESKHAIFKIVNTTFRDVGF